MILKDATSGQGIWVNPKMIQYIRRSGGACRIVFEGGQEVVVESASLEELVGHLGIESTLARIIPFRDGFVIERDVSPHYLTSCGWDTVPEVFPTRADANRVKAIYAK